LAAQTALARNGGSDPQAQVFSTLVSAAQSPAAAKTALPQARTILQHNPRDLPALMVCAAAAQVDGDFKGAIGYYETALAAFPQFPLALWQSAVLWAGPLGDDDKAFGFAEKAEASFPSDLTLAKILGRGAYKRGDYARSSRILQDASNQAPDGEMLYYLGMDYYKLQRAADSKKTLEKALAMNIPPALATDAKRALAEMQ
jgi:tetratricopeptide (TPR) repeat protein